MQIPILPIGLNPEALKRTAGLLKTFGIDPASIASHFARVEVEKLLNTVVAPVAARLERDGLTPARKGESAEAETLLVRSALYLLFKDLLRPHVQQPVLGYVADGLRDAYAFRVCKQVTPQFNHTTTTGQLVSLVAAELVEVMF